MAKRKKFDNPDLFDEPEKFWRTEGLFSHHYLKTHLKDDNIWPGDDDVRPIWEFCRELHNKLKNVLGNLNEATIRKEFINPILNKLGYDWLDEINIPDEGEKPDYLLFPDKETKESVIGKDLKDLYNASIGILEAKKFNLPLSRISKSQKRFPHQQVRDYLSNIQVLDWGVLTSGNKWRLYYRNTKPREYFELDFVKALEKLDDFKFFVILFSPSAFQRDAQGKCLLDNIREGALSAQTVLEEDLRKRVFTILENLANGFYTFEENGISEKDLPDLYENCLIYLYRLLFILYAEGRNLLKVKPKTRRYYKTLSLERLKPTLRDTTSFDDKYLTRLCESIHNLFQLINGDKVKMNEEYDVPRYNGGLFDPEKYPHLECWKIADSNLSEVLRKLMFSEIPDRVQSPLPLETVDYSDLRIQQLGSIYEGLLEHHLILSENGNLELKSDKVERKATGTYYTPDYIVKYIVEQTHTPLIDESDESEPVRKAKEVGLQDNSFAEAVLKLNICDPAMGSGHFLVESTIYLADEIAYHQSTRPLSDKSKDEEEIAYWRRRVVEACIYGVDLNPLAVELAKLSLWLTCISSDQPLNFLDHHLRVGNSLIGARLDQLGSLPLSKKKRGRDQDQQVIVFGADFKKAVAETVKGIQQIEEEASRTVATVKDKERRWNEEILPHLSPYRQIADLWTSTFFGIDIDIAEYIDKAQKIVQKPDKKYEQHSRRFFHWELEFPDVFFNEDGSPKTNPGFDAVVGNPPWVSMKGKHKSGDYCEAEINCLLYMFQGDSYRPNLIEFFSKCAVSNLRIGGYHSYIVPDRFAENKQYTNLRCYFLEHNTITTIAFRVPFPEVIADTLIYVVRRGAFESLGVKVWEWKTPELKTCVPVSVFLSGYDKAIFYVGSEKETNFIIRLLGMKPKLAPGISQTNTGFIASKNTVTERRIEENQIPILKGENVLRYAISGEFYFHFKNNNVIGGTSDPSVLSVECKVLIRKTGSALRASFCAGGFFPEQSLYQIWNIQRPYSPHFILTILNSQLVQYLYSKLLVTNRDTTPQLKKIDLDKIPIRSIAFTTPNEKRSSLLAEAKKLYASSVSEVDPATILSFVSKQLSAKPELSDVVHDLLAFLAEQIIALNSEKHSASQQFFTDLQDFHRIDAHSLKPKSKLDEFWKLEISDLFEHFKKNRKILGQFNVNLDEEAENKIRSRFQEAKDTILPLESQIAFTDRLIDLIVYKLYGLTVEEISIVEGVFKSQ